MPADTRGPRPGPARIVARTHVVGVIDLGQGARGNVGQAGGLGHAVRHVNAKTVGSAVEPEAQNALELGGHFGVGPVEIGLLSREQVQVPLTVRDASPGGPPNTDGQLFGGARLADLARRGR